MPYNMPELDNLFLIYPACMYRVGDTAHVVGEKLRSRSFLKQFITFTVHVLSDLKILA
jgi:hypothetical protein